MEAVWLTYWVTVTVTLLWGGGLRGTLPLPVSVVELIMVEFIVDGLNMVEFVVVEYVVLEVALVLLTVVVVTTLELAADDVVFRVGL